MILSAKVRVYANDETAGALLRAPAVQPSPQGQTDPDKNARKSQENSESSFQAGFGATASVHP